MKLKASAEPPALTWELKGDEQNGIMEMESGCDLFGKLKNGFLSFKAINIWKTWNAIKHSPRVKLLNLW